VLKQIKNGVSIFLPKYYVVTNRENPHSDCLFMDFIPSRNLKEYLHTNSASVSLLTKLYLAFSILQGLRYIRDYHIVHLDLKPNNVMIYCNMLIKLIDFGEAYHPELPPHKPGYTIPYSPPEMYIRGGKFTTKSDVFSFGVLLFEMLYGVYPYDIFTPAKLVPSAMQQHLKQWYYAPE
jgi:serine/threonine protein kinase